MTTTTTKTEEKLNRAWNKAAKAGDTHTLQILRKLFEGFALGVGVSAKITPRTMERLEYADTVEAGEDPNRLMIGGVCYWADFESAEEDADVLAENVEDEIMRAQMENFTDLTLAQEDFQARQITRSMRNAECAIRNAIASVKANYYRT